MSFITVPAAVVPLLYSGLELEIWGLDGELEEAFPTRSENPAWFEAPIDRLNRTCELLRMIDWLRTGPPVEATVEIDTWRDILVGGLQAELLAQRDHRDASGNGPGLRDEARKAIGEIERFLDALPRLEAEAAEETKPAQPYADQDTAERAIVLQVLRDDHDERWSRVDIQAELHDVEPQAVAAALEQLHHEGAVHLSGGLVWASRCARRLDDLGMVSI
jgi:hypothetical protein